MSNRFQMPATLNGAFPTDFTDDKGKHYNYTRLGVRIAQDKGYGFTEQNYKYGTHENCQEFKDVEFPAEVILDVSLSNDGGLKVHGWRAANQQKPQQQAPKA